MARSSRRKNAQPPKEKTDKASTEATSSNPTAEKPPASLPKEIPTATTVATPAIVQPQPETMQVNPVTTVAPTDATTDDEDLDPEKVIQEFMKKYGKGPKVSKFFAQMSEACRKQEDDIPALTPLTIPPRPHTLIETPTSQDLSTHQENPQILPETLTPKIIPTVPNPQIETLPQETTPPDTIPQTEIEHPTIEKEEIEEIGDKMDTEGSESEEDRDGKVEQERREGEILEEKDATGSGNEGETREDVEGHEGCKTGEEKEVESESEWVEEQDVEGNVGNKEGLEGRLGEVSEVNADGRENPDGEKESVPEEEEEVDKPAEEEDIETEIVLLDDVKTDDQEAPRDERSIRRQFRRSKKHKDEALASRAKRLRLEDIEETEEAILQVQETLAAKKDISPEALETRYEAERK